MKFLASSRLQRAEFSERTLYVFVIFAILVIKLTVLMAWGPGIAPDSAGYTQFASIILEGTNWLADAGLQDSAMPTTVFRIAGYPTFIALAQLIAADSWEWFVVFSQFLLTVISLISLSRFISVLGVNPFVGAFCLVSTGLSFSLLLDNMILTDSFAASIFVIVLSENAVSSLRAKPLGITEAFLLGVLVALAFLVREGVAILSILFVIPFLVRAYLSAGQRFRSYATIAVFYVPLVFISQIYMSWNENRTGYRFVTSGGQTVYLQGVLDAAEKDERILSGSDVIDMAARNIVKDYSFAEVLAIQGSLFGGGFVAPELANLSKEKYFKSWMEYPGAMLRMTIGHIRENYATLTFRPMDSIRQTGLWVNGEKPWPDHRELRNSMFDDAEAFVLFVGEMIERLVAIAITVAFVMIPLVWVTRLYFGKNTRKRETLVCASLWAVYFGVLFAHAMVHLETRYLVAVIPFSTVLGCFGIQCALRRQTVRLFNS